MKKKILIIMAILLSIVLLSYIFILRPKEQIRVVERKIEQIKLNYKLCKIDATLDSQYDRCLEEYKLDLSTVK